MNILIMKKIPKFTLLVIGGVILTAQLTGCIFLKHDNGNHNGPPWKHHNKHHDGVIDVRVHK